MPVCQTVRTDDKKLNEIRKALKGFNLVTKVGIVGSPKARVSLEPSSMTNAEIGMLNEFGHDHAPPRSWLRMPLEFKRRDIIKFLQSDAVKKLILDGKVREVFLKLGLVAEAIIQDGFETSGFGKWIPNAPLTIALKGSAKPLIDTAQLRRSVTSEVVQKKDIKK